MPKLIDLIQVNRLLDQLAAVEEKLTPNERELFHKLKAKYREPRVLAFQCRFSKLRIGFERARRP